MRRMKEILKLTIRKQHIEHRTMVNARKKLKNNNINEWYHLLLVEITQTYPYSSRSWLFLLFMFTGRIFHA